MCTVSMIGDHFGDKWGQEPYKTYFEDLNKVTRAEFEQLKREVEEMKSLLKRAKKYDEDNGEPDCEIEDKIALLRKIAKMVGVDLDDVFQGG